MSVIHASVPRASWQVFEVRTSGKWVLAGEHAVLRGVPAIALPHPELGLSLHFEPGVSSSFEILPSEGATLVREILFSVLGSIELPPRGRLTVQSTIPLGAGLGSSAALCVALTRWLAGPLSLPEKNWVEFATRLEDRFHGKSSGMDVAVISAQSPVRYIRGEGCRLLSVSRLPRLSFHDTGLRARTSECVAHVEEFGRAHPTEAAHFDRLMGQAALEAEQGLELYASQPLSGLTHLTHAMDLSHECFEAWGLVPPSVRELRQKLLAQGARAAKLTGAGRGGFVVALWD